MFRARALCFPGARRAPPLGAHAATCSLSYAQCPMLCPMLVPMLGALGSASHAPCPAAAGSIALTASTTVTVGGPVLAAGGGGGRCGTSTCTCMWYGAWAPGMASTNLVRSSVPGLGLVPHAHAHIACATLLMHTCSCPMLGAPWSVSSLVLTMLRCHCSSMLHTHLLPRSSTHCLSTRWLWRKE